MFNDRDLGVLGCGALGAILCLVLPWAFAAKIAIAMVLLVISMALAFARVGVDRLTLEQYLKRQLAYRYKPRLYSYFRKSEPLKSSSVPVVSATSAPLLRPVSFRIEHAGMYWLMTVWLAVIGCYVVYWAEYLGGITYAAFWIKQQFKK